MKKIIIIIIFGVVAVIALSFYLLRPKIEAWKLRKNINSSAIEYVTSILLIQDYDSIKINKIDSLSDLRLAQISLELLEEMKFNYEYLYQDLLINAGSDSELDQLYDQILEIDAVIADQHNLINDDNTESKNLNSYLISATYYTRKEAVPFLFLTTPKGKYKELNPFL